MGERKAAIRAERDALAASAEVAAKDLETLAREIERAITNLPRFTKPSTVALLQQQADRAQAIANALAVESRDADPEVVRSLLRARKAVAVVVIAVLASVGTGAAEEAGADLFHGARSIAVDIAAEGKAEQDLPPLESMRLGESIRGAREATGVSQSELAKVLRVNKAVVGRWEAGAAVPTGRTWSALNEWFHGVDTAGLDPEDREVFRAALDYMDTVFRVDPEAWDAAEKRWGSGQPSS